MKSRMRFLLPNRKSYKRNGQDVTRTRVLETICKEHEKSESSEYRMYMRKNLLDLRLIGWVNCHGVQNKILDSIRVTHLYNSDSKADSVCLPEHILFP